MENQAAKVRATRYVASLRPAMYPEAARIARLHIEQNVRANDAREILALIEALTA